eukprot:scaffold5064_cov121-Cylindrotheca_fusiformis.AAC.16
MESSPSQSGADEVELTVLRHGQRNPSAFASRTPAFVRKRFKRLEDQPVHRSPIDAVVPPSKAIVLRLNEAGMVVPPTAVDKHVIMAFPDENKSKCRGNNGRLEEDVFFFGRGDSYRIDNAIADSPLPTFAMKHAACHSAT